MSKLNDLLVKVRPLISATALEDAAGIPKNTLGKHYRWVDGKANGQAISQWHGANIIRALCSIWGVLKLGNDLIYASFDEPEIIVITRTGKVEDVETTLENGSVFFVYKEEQHRALYDDYEFSFIYLKDEAKTMATVVKLKMEGSIDDPITLSKTVDFEGTLEDCAFDLERSKKSWAKQHSIHPWMGDTGFLVEDNSGKAMLGYYIVEK